jgi:hypothetical protein
VIDAGNICRLTEVLRPAGIILGTRSQNGNFLIEIHTSILTEEKAKVKGFGNLAKYGVRYKNEVLVMDDDLVAADKEKAIERFVDLSFTHRTREEDEELRQLEIALDVPVQWRAATRLAERAAARSKRD